MRQCCFTVEDKVGRTGHINAVIALAPFDLQRTTIHQNGALAPSLANNSGCNSRSAGPRTTSLSDAAATFPDARPDATVRQNLRKLYVAALWKGRVPLQPSSGLTHLVHIVSEDNEVRIAHRDKRPLVHFPRGDI